MTINKIHDPNRNKRHSEEQPERKRITEQGSVKAFRPFQRITRIFGPLPPDFSDYWLSADPAGGNDYQKALNSLREGDRKGALEHLRKAEGFGEDPDRRDTRTSKDGKKGNEK